MIRHRPIRLPFGVPLGIAVLAAIPVVFGFWSVALALSVGALRSQVEANVQLTGQLGDIERTVRELEGAFSTRGVSTEGTAGSLARLRLQLAAANGALQKNERAPHVIGAQLTASVQAGRDVDAEAAKYLNAVRAGAETGGVEQSLKAATTRLVDTVSEATRIVRRQLSELSKQLGRKWTQLNLVAAGVAILGLTLAGLAISYERALREVRQLRGILPMCSYCKRIRNDRDYWQQLETYISEHSAAQFSHGVCPACYADVVHDFTRN